MNTSELQELIIQILTEIQAMSGRPPSDMAKGSRPIGDLPGFDSLNGLEATVELAHRLDCVIPEDINLFVSEKGDRALRIHEISIRLQKLLSSKVVTNDR